MIAMLYGVISDIHGHLENLEEALRLLRDLAVGRIVCTGDVLGKGGGNLGSLDALFAVGAILLRGNHDRISIPDLPLAYRAVLEKAMKLTHREGPLLFAHTATVRKVAYGLPPWEDNDLLATDAQARDQFENETFHVFFHGHLHWPALTSWHAGGVERLELQPPARFSLEDARRYIVNVGPVTDRKDIDRENPHHRRAGLNSAPSCVTYDDQALELRFHAIGKGDVGGSVCGDVSGEIQ